jgi:hypothetical protein
MSHSWLLSRARCLRLSYARMNRLARATEHYSLSWFILVSSSCPYFVPSQQGLSPVILARSS